MGTVELRRLLACRFNQYQYMDDWYVSLSRQPLIFQFHPVFSQAYLGGSVGFAYGRGIVSLPVSLSPPVGWVPYTIFPSPSSIVPLSEFGGRYGPFSIVASWHVSGMESNPGLEDNASTSCFAPSHPVSSMSPTAFPVQALKRNIISASSFSGSVLYLPFGFQCTKSVIFSHSNHILSQLPEYCSWYGPSSKLAESVRSSNKAPLSAGVRKYGRSSPPSWIVSPTSQLLSSTIPILRDLQRNLEMHCGLNFSLFPSVSH